MTVSDASAFDDPYIPLAFSVHSTPGAYAVLAGAGVSFGSVPTAWDIVLDLAKQVCGLDGDTATAASLDKDNVSDWFRDRTGKTLTYGGLLAEAAPRPEERGAVLRGFFQDEGPDGKPVLHEPTGAHHAVARLVANGSVRVIVTMNFDHLFEDALKKQGIDPYIISTDQNAKDRPPLHTKRCTVVHLHGSYLDASSMLNTDTELGAYQTHMQSLLTEIVRTHGLLIAGWSASWDKALRETVIREYPPFYTPAWITPNELEPEAQEVVETIGASVLSATANAAFTRLADAVDTLQAHSVRHPVTAQVVVDRIKRDLSGGGPAITAHDTFTAELGRLDDLSELTSNLFIGEDYDERLATIDEASRVAAAATAVLARWGNDETDRWWLDALDQWSRATYLGPSISGRSKFLELPLLVGTRLFYAAGIAAMVGRRHQLLTQLFTRTAVADYQRRGPARTILAWDARHANTRRAVTNPMREQLAGVLADALGVSKKRMDVLWQEFETLRTAAVILTHPNARHQMDAYIGASNRLDDVKRGGSGDLRAAAIEEDRELHNLARLANPDAQHPHVRVAMVHRPEEPNPYPFISDVAERLEELSEPHPALAGLPGKPGNSTSVQLALRATRAGFHLTATAIAGRSGGTPPDDFWFLDIPQG